MNISLSDLKHQFSAVCLSISNGLTQVPRVSKTTTEQVAAVTAHGTQRIWNGAPHQGSNHLSVLFSALPAVKNLDTREECVAQLEAVNSRREAWIKTIQEKFNMLGDGEARQPHKKDFISALKKVIALRNHGTKCVALYRMTKAPTGGDPGKLKKDLHERCEKAVAAMHKIDQLEADLYLKFVVDFGNLNPPDLDPSLKDAEGGDEYAPFKTMLTGAAMYTFLFPLGYPLLTWPVLGVGTMALTTKTQLISVAKTVASNAVYGGAIAALTGELCGMSPENKSRVFFWPAVITGLSLAQDLKPKVLGLVQKAADTVLNSAKAYVREIRTVPITLVTPPIAYSLLSGEPLINGLKLGVVASATHAAAVGLFALAESAED